MRKFSSKFDKNDRNLANFELNFLKNEEYVFHKNWGTTIFRCVLSIGGGIFQKFPQNSNSGFRFNTQTPFHASAMCAIDSLAWKNPAGYFPNDPILPKPHKF